MAALGMKTRKLIYYLMPYGISTSIVLMSIGAIVYTVNHNNTVIDTHWQRDVAEVFFMAIVLISIFWPATAVRNLRLRSKIILGLALLISMGGTCYGYQVTFGRMSNFSPANWVYFLVCCFSLLIFVFLQSEKPHRQTN